MQVIPITLLEIVPCFSKLFWKENAYSTSQDLFPNSNDINVSEIKSDWNTIKIRKTIYFNNKSYKKLILLLINAIIYMFLLYYCLKVRLFYFCGVRIRYTRLKVVRMLVLKCGLIKY